MPPPPARPPAPPGARPASPAATRPASPAATRPAPRATGPRPPATRRRSAFRERQVFYRWLWLVYVPWLLGALAIVAAVSGLVPHQGKPFLVVLLAWNAAGVGLFLLRRHRGVHVPVPRNAVTGLAWLAALSLGGLILIIMGLNRMGSKDGPTLMVAGAFLGLVALLAPIFKLVDVLGRTLGRALVAPRRPARRPSRVQAPRRPVRRRVA